jgi:hypothetical protein
MTEERSRADDVAVPGNAATTAATPPLPDFLVIGVQKGGTHWIRENLSAHPDVFMPADELHFFARPEWVEHHGIDGYRRLFAGWEGQRVVGEATPGYLMWRHDPEAMAGSIQAMLPDVRLVAILRDPVERALSALVHFRRIDVIRHHDPDLTTAVGRLSPPDRDPNGLVTGGWYAASLRPYLDRFGDRLLVLLNDDLQADPAAVYDRLLAHVGLEPGFRPPGLDRWRFSFDPARFGVRPPTPAERAELFDLFASDVDELEELLDRDLSAWRTGAPSSRPKREVGAVGADDDADAAATGARVRDLPGHAPRDWTTVLAPTSGQPRLVERDGTTVVIEGGLLRPVASPLVARALRHRLGASEATSAELDVLLPGPPVVLIKTPGETAFVVVGGRRLNVPGVGTMVFTDDDWYARLEPDAPLDLLRAAEELQDERRRGADGTGA